MRIFNFFYIIRKTPLFAEKLIKMMRFNFESLVVKTHLSKNQPILCWPAKCSIRLPESNQREFAVMQSCREDTSHEIVNCTVKQIAHHTVSRGQFFPTPRVNGARVWSALFSANKRSRTCLSHYARINLCSCASRREATAWLCIHHACLISELLYFCVHNLVLIVKKEILPKKLLPYKFDQ